MAATTQALVVAVCTALQRNADNLAAVLRRISDPTPRAIGSWSIGETANHVANSHRYFMSALRGETTLEAVDEIDVENARRLAEDPERDPSVLADRLETGARELVDFALAMEDDPLAEPFVGVAVPLSTVLAIELGEVMVHGHDIAKAAGQRWSVDASDARTALRALLPLLPFLLRRKRAADARVDAEIRVRGLDPYVVLVHDGTVDVEDAAGQHVDFTMSVEPEAYLLTFFNRVNPWTQVLRGRLLVWGRRPWKIQTFRTAFVT